MAETKKQKPSDDRPLSPYINPDLAVKKPWQARIGGSPALLISIFIHLVFIALALYFVVQSIHEKRKQTFTEVSVTPKLQQVQQSNVQLTQMKQAQSAPDVTQRIVTSQLSTVNLPPVEFPTDNSAEGSGKMGAATIGGSGQGPGVQGGGGAPLPISVDVSGIATAFGLVNGRGVGLEGHFYDLKQNRNRIPTGMTVDKFPSVIGEFMKAGWPSDFFKNYFVGPLPLYLTQLYIPYQSATDGPKAFNLQDSVQPKMWVVLYEGTLHVAHSGTFRFVGRGDDLCEVAIDHKIVLDGCLSETLPAVIAHHGMGSYRYDFNTDIGNVTIAMITGDWITLGNGKDHTIQVLIGEHPGGRCGFWLMVEQQGHVYEKAPNGSPLLPLFKLSSVTVPDPKMGCPPYDKKDDLEWSIPGSDSDPVDSTTSVNSDSKN